MFNLEGSMQKYVISLENAFDRRKHIESEFLKQDITFSFFDAILPDEATLLATELKLNIQDEFLSQTELACLMSHVSLWKKVVDENIAYIAIFEDDIFLGENAGKILNKTDWISSDLSIIKLEHFYSKVVLGRKVYSVTDTDRNIFELKGPNLGAAGYILSNEAAKKCIEYLEKSVAIPVDHLMFDKWIQEGLLKVHQTNPAVCIQELSLGTTQKIKLESSLCDAREKRMRKHKKKGWSKFKNECRRIGRQIKFALTQNSVYFK